MTLAFDALKPLMLAAGKDPTVLLAPEADALIAAVRAEEQAHAMQRFLPMLLYWWKDRTSLTPGEKLKAGNAICRQVALEAPRAYSPAERLQIAAFLMRFSRASNVQFAALLAPLTPADWPALETDSFFDYLILEAEAKNWPTLSAAAMAWLDRGEGSPLQRTFAADFLFLASFQAHKRNSPAKKRALVLPPEQALDRLAAHIPADGKNMAVYRGLVKCLAGSVRASVDDFVAANKAEGPTLQYFRSAEHVMDWPALVDLQTRAEAEVAADRLPTPLHALEHHVRHDSRDGCLLLSCDITYFNSFIDHLSESYGLHNPGGLLQLHCIRFQPEEARLKAIEAHCNIRINYTVDPVPGVTGARDLFRGYCAGARYLWLPHYLARHDFVAVADIDGVILRPLAPLWEQSPEAVLLLTGMDLETEQSCNPIWGHIAAGIFALRNLPEHRVYAHMLSHFMAARFAAACERDEKFFYADQTALMQCFLHLRDRCGFARIKESFFRQAGNTVTSERWQDKKNWQQTYIDKTRAAGDAANGPR